MVWLKLPIEFLKKKKEKKDDYHIELCRKLGKLHMVIERKQEKTGEIKSQTNKSWPTSAKDIKLNKTTQKNAWVRGYTHSPLKKYCTYYKKKRRQKQVVRDLPHINHILTKQTKRHTRK